MINIIFILDILDSMTLFRKWSAMVEMYLRLRLLLIRGPPYPSICNPSTLPLAPGKVPGSWHNK